MKSSTLKECEINMKSMECSRLTLALTRRLSFITDAFITGMTGIMSLLEISKIFRLIVKGMKIKPAHRINIYEHTA